jgi:hypothetical protein
VGKLVKREPKCALPPLDTTQADEAAAAWTWDPEPTAAEHIKHTEALELCGNGRCVGSQPVAREAL